jgi:hypothetical protein
MMEQKVMLKTLLKCPNSFVCSRFIKDKLPNEEKISSFAFCSGHIELDLFQNNYDISVFSNRYYVWEFWKCMINSAESVLDTAKHFHKVLTPRDIQHYRDNWLISFEDPYERAALFYLLNRYSENGNFSYSEVDKNNLSYLNFVSFERSMSNVRLLDLHLDKRKDFSKSFKLLDSDSILLIPVGVQRNGFLKNKNVTTPETYVFDHQKMKEYVLSERQKVILIYKYSDFTDKFFENKTYISKFGTITENPELAEDLIVSNF